MKSVLIALITNSNINSNIIPLKGYSYINVRIFGYFNVWKTLRFAWNCMSLIYLSSPELYLYVSTREKYFIWIHPPIVLKWNVIQNVLWRKASCSTYKMNRIKMHLILVFISLKAILERFFQGPAVHSKITKVKGCLLFLLLKINPELLWKILFLYMTYRVTQREYLLCRGG